LFRNLLRLEAPPTDQTLDTELTAALQTAGFTGTIESQFTDPKFPFLGRAVNPQLADLGRNLFFDKILGLNNDNACAGCHSPLRGMGDTQPIAIGVGNNNIVGPSRTGPRNMRRAPLILNTPLYPTMMWNARFVATSNNPFVAKGGFQFPAPEGQGFNTSSIFFGPAPGLNLSNLATAQVFLPTPQFNEMAGFSVPNTIVAGTIGGPGTKNPDSTAVAIVGDSPFDPTDAHNVIRNNIVTRLNAAPEYRKLFNYLYPGQVNRKTGGITYVMVASAIAEFEFSMVRANAPIDQFARGQTGALTRKQKQGALLFFTPTASGGAGCITCHSVSGKSNEMFSDFGFHVSGVPQIVPTYTNTLFDSDANGTVNQDFAWSEFTLRPADKFKFRTAPLRNIALAPYFFHDGIFNNLEDAIAFHLDANKHAPLYSPKGRLPQDLTGPMGPLAPILQLLNNPIAEPGTPPTTPGAPNPLATPVVLTKEQFHQLVDFVRNGLLDPRAQPDQLRSLIPATLPSGMTPLVFED
jgi:cytochrome c peroxidase